MTARLESGKPARSGPGRAASRVTHARDWSAVRVRQSLVAQVAPPTVTVICAPGGGPLR
jgi:hypothetical protein